MQKASRSRIYQVAALAPCDHRIAKRALEKGVETIHITALRDAVASAIRATEQRTDSKSPHRAAS